MLPAGLIVLLGLFSHPPYDGNQVNSSRFVVLGL